MPLPILGQRGPTEHTRREQIIEAADDHFRHYGYGKTTVADLANAIGLSTAYIYKFFESKQAIGEAVCRRCLTRVATELQAVVDDDKPATERLRRVFLLKARRAAEMFFHERKLHEIVVAAQREQWGSMRAHDESLRAFVERIVREGRETGEFERKTPLDETCNGILLVFQPFQNPILLAQKLDDLDRDVAAITALVLRSLVP
jgi:AcrR family transcriptional regulator